MTETTKDPVCGMPVGSVQGFALARDGATLRFCSQLCMKTFLADPSRFDVAPLSAPTERSPAERRIAYLSLEVAVDSRMPTYSGGLGVLAGDTLRACADLRIPVVGVSLLYSKGYFDQRLDAWGTQEELPSRWSPEDVVRPLAETVTIELEGRSVTVRAWCLEIAGRGVFKVPLILLDTRAPENAVEDRELTAWLYGGDERYRLAQEAVLGIGGLRMLRKLGYSGLERFHMNEGHAALLAVELLRELSPDAPKRWDFDAVRSRCVFTTHTPVPAGHDRFAWDLVERTLTDSLPRNVMEMLAGDDRLNMTLLAMNLSQYVNGVAKKHGEVSRGMFPLHTIDAITNGVHSASWTHPSFAKLFDRCLPGWAMDPFLLRNALRLPANELWAAHLDAKRCLLAAVHERTGESLDAGVLTMGFGRRATSYKRLHLVLHDPERLKHIAREVGPIQLVLAGKAHPKDQSGREAIQLAFRVARELRDQMRIVYLPNYDLALARAMTSGSDLWLNTPLRPLEASGTSGMKAAHNGVPSLSVREGWWLEGHVEGVTGWSIGSDEISDAAPSEVDAREASDLYDKLGRVIVPLYYGDTAAWIQVMRQVIAFNASFFNAHRMVQQYAANAYL